MKTIIILSVIWILATLIYFIIFPILKKNISEKLNFKKKIDVTEMFEKNYKVNIIYNDKETISLDNYADIILNLNDLLNNNNQNQLSNKKQNTFLKKNNVNFNNLLNITSIKK